MQRKVIGGNLLEDSKVRKCKRSRKTVTLAEKSRETEHNCLVERISKSRDLVLSGNNSFLDPTFRFSVLLLTIVISSPPLPMVTVSPTTQSGVTQLVLRFLSVKPR